MRIIVFIILFLITLFGCNQDGKINNNKGLFDYETISTLNVDVVLEIAETDGYIPGNIRDLVLLYDGSLLISDMQHTTIELFGENGSYLGTIATAGNGPGELNSFFNLIDTGNDTLIVRQLMSWRLDYFARDKKTGNFSYIQSSAPKTFERPVTVLGARPGSGYYATTTFEDRDRQLPFMFEPLVIVDDSEAILQDSLGLLKTPNPVVDDIPSGGLNIFGVPPYQFRDRFISMNEKGYLIARPDSSALYLYNHDHELIRSIDIKMKARPVRTADLETVLKNNERDIRSRMEERIGDTKPPFMNLWISEEYILLHTDYTEKEQELLVLAMNGTPVGKLLLPEYDDVQYFRNNRIYSIHKNPDVGHSIRIYQLDL